MKVLIVYPKFSIYGGAEILIVRLCNFLSRMNVENSILSTQMMPEVKKDLIDTDIIIVKNRFINTKLEVFGALFVLRKALKHQENNFDVINIHNYPAELAALNCKKPTIWMCNEPELYLNVVNKNVKNSSLQNIISVKLLFLYEKIFLKRKINKVIVSDKFNARRFRKIYKMEPVIINYGIDYDFFSKKIFPPEFKKRYNQRFVIIHVGMITNLKNQLESLKAIKAVINRIPRAVLIFAGSYPDNDYKKLLDDYIKKYNLVDSVEFTGHVNRYELKKYYYLANVMIHPIKSQGGWLSPFEMLCAEKPVIVSEELTAADIIKSNNIGIVTNKYADALFDVYQNYQKYAKMAKGGKVFVRKNLSWESFSSKMLNEFQNLVNEVSS